MPNTYTLIASNTLSSSAASITFSAIPNTYTDLCLKISARSSVSGAIDGIYLTFNASGSIYSSISLTANGASASMFAYSNATEAKLVRSFSGDTTTSNTFGNIEIYVPSYGASQNKPLSGFGVAENNSTTAYISATAGLYRDTGAITSLSMTTANLANFMTGSTFWLYGIKNS